MLSVTLFLQSPGLSFMLVTTMVQEEGDTEASFCMVSPATTQLQVSTPLFKFKDIQTGVVLASERVLEIIKNS